MRTLLLGLALAAAPSAWAVPHTFTHQGRVLDGAGDPLTGDHAVTVSLFDAATAGTQVFTSTQTATFDAGYFSLVLSGLDPEDFGGDVFVELRVDGGAAIGARQPLTSVPTALAAEVATDLRGGTVEATGITVGNLVIGPDGSITVNGTTVVGADGALGGEGPGDLVCAAGQAAVHDGTAWGCAANLPTGAEIRGAVEAASVTLAAGTTLAGATISTGAHLSLADLSSGAVALGAGSTVGGAAISTGAHFTGPNVTTWLDTNAVDLATGTTLNGAAISTGAHYTDSDAEAFLTSTAVDLAVGTTLDGEPISTGPHYDDADVGSYLASTPLVLAAGTTITGVSLPPAGPQPAPGTARNLLVNPGFDIWQRGNAAAPDRWTASGTVTVARGLNTNGRASYAQFTATSATPYLFQKLETPTDWAGLTVTLSIDVWQSAGSGAFVEISDGVGTSTAPVPQSTGFTRITLVRTIAASPTRVGVRIFPGNGTLRVDSAALAVGTYSNVPYVPPDPTSDLLAAQRYYEAARSTVYSDDGAENPGNAGWIQFRSPKASSPSVSVALVTAECSGNPQHFTGPRANEGNTLGFGYDQENEDPEQTGGASAYKVTFDWVASVAETW